ncbi:phage tail sheath family protein [Exiguobacterium acetylicum]|uniref:phage tail sheath family protein n=1 Tax=Exiguobacterium acetylicum TaxID=41170 RepID=UPI0030174BCE
MPYEHGINLLENPTSVTPPITADSSIQVVIGTAPIHLTADPTAAVNKPILAYTRSAAVDKLGYSDNFSAFTLCEAIYASFQVASVAPVVFINVLDPAVHKVNVPSHPLTLVGGKGVVDVEGVLLSSIVVKQNTTTLVKNVDYIIAFNKDGKPAVTLLSTVVPANATLTLAFDKLDPSLVTKTDIIGGYDAITKKYKGAELIRSVYPMFNVLPGLILAPGWSHIPEVGIILDAKAKSINGTFKAMAICDLNSDTVKSYEDVSAWKETNGYTSEYTIACWPMVKIGDRQLHFSSVYAATIASVDARNDSVPFESPSNERFPITAAVRKDGVEVYLDQLEANHLNGSGIVTALNWNGWKTWGNNTAAYPNTTDPKDRFIAIRRMFNWWGNTFILTYFQKVDDPTNFRLIESIVDSENVRANGYVARGQIAGAVMEFREELNPVTNILNGKIVFIQRFAAFPPAEQITNILEFDPTILTNALFGGGQ